MATAQERREKDAQRELLMEPLRLILHKQEGEATGMPAIAVPLDKIYTFKMNDGERHAVMPLRELVYLVDEILRAAE